MSEKDPLSSQFKDPAEGLSPEEKSTRYGSDRAERQADKARKRLATAAADAFDDKKSGEESQPVRALRREPDLGICLPRRDKDRGYGR